jgi:hypothetical protein
MTSSDSCSSRRTLLALAAVLVSACAHGGAHGRAPALSITRVALFPVESDGPEPEASFAAAIELAIARSGLDIVSTAAVEPALALRRIRTSGVDRTAAQVVREELGAEAVLLLSVQRYVADVPILTVTARLVSVGEQPFVLWMDGFSRSAATTHGLLGLGGIHSMDEMEREAAAELSRSLADFIRTRAQRGRCGAGKHFRPRTYYRAPWPLPGRRVIVLPFLNRTKNRTAGDFVALQIVRQFAASGQFDVVDPGAVLEALRKERIITRGGVSLAEAERMAKSLDADLVVSGEVFQHDDAVVPTAEFTTMMLDRDDRLVWQSTSRSTGEDAVSVFDFGRLGTLGEVTCRMAAGVIAGIIAGEP